MPRCTLHPAGGQDPAVGLLADGRAEQPGQAARRCGPCGRASEAPLSTPRGRLFCAGCLLTGAARRGLCPLRCQPGWPPSEPRRGDRSARGRRRDPQLPRLAKRASGPARCSRRGPPGLLPEGDCGAAAAPPPAAAAAALAAGAGRRWEEPEAPMPEAGGLCRQEGAAGGGGGSCCCCCRRRPPCCPRPLLARAPGRPLAEESAGGPSQGEAALRGQPAAPKCRQKCSRPVGPGSHLDQRPGEGVQPKCLTIMLRREKNALGFNIVGGLANQGSQVESAEGIYVSRIVENGPADKAEGLQINDKIIEHARATNLGSNHSW